MVSKLFIFKKKKQNIFTLSFETRYFNLDSLVWDYLALDKLTM